MATYLDLCRDAVREAGTASYEGMTDVAAGELPYQQMAGWVRRAWRQIQTGRDDFTFQRRSFSKEIDPSMGSSFRPEALVGPAGIRKWLFVGVRNEQAREWSLTDLATAGQTDGALIYIDWAVFRRRFIFVPQSPGRPLYFSAEPDMTIHVAPAMQEGSRYRLVGDYIASTQDLVANGDVPQGLPEDHHDAIMWLAVVFALQFQGGSDLAQMQAAQMEYDRAIGALRLEFVPEIRYQRPPI